MANQQAYLGQSGAVYYNDATLGWYPAPNDTLPLGGALCPSMYVTDDPTNDLHAANKKYVDYCALFERSVHKDIQPKVRALVDGGGFFNVLPTILTSGILTVGVAYTIFDWIADDDFVNVGGVNADGAVFVATGTTPTHWAHKSELIGSQTLGSAVFPWSALYASAIYATSSLTIGSLAGILKAVAGVVGTVTIGSSLSYSNPTLDTIQDIRTIATPTFAGVIISDAGTVGLGSGKGLIQFDDETVDLISFLNCQVDFITAHGTTLLIDHIGEHVNAHTVVFDSTVTIGTLEGILKAATGVVAVAAIGSSLSYSASTLDAIQDIRTIATPQFAAVRLSDTDASHYLALIFNQAEAAASRTLNFILGSADRTITLSGSPTLADWFDQAVKEASGPSFDHLHLTIAGGTAPLNITSTTMCSNLNADLLDGKHASEFQGSGVPAAHVLLSATHTDTVPASAVLGDTLYADATPAWTKLAGNTTTTKKFLAQTGTGLISAVPAWDTIVDGDVPATHSGSAHHVAVTLATAGDTLLGLSGQALDLDTQAANLLFGGPVSGAATAPTFRSLVDADFPATLNPTFAGLTLYDATSALTLLDISNAVSDDIFKVASDGKVRIGANPLNYNSDAQVLIIKGDTTGVSSSGTGIFCAFLNDTTSNVIIGMGSVIRAHKDGCAFILGSDFTSSVDNNAGTIYGAEVAGTFYDAGLVGKNISATTLYGGSLQALVSSTYASGGNSVAVTTVYTAKPLVTIQAANGNTVSVTNVYGSHNRVYAYGSGVGSVVSMGSAYGVYSLIDCRGVGLATITNAYGVYIASPGYAGNLGTIVNDYGLYIEDQSRGTTLNYAIYSAGGLVHIENLTASLPVITNATKELASLAYQGATSFRKNLGLETDDLPTFAGLTVGTLAGVLKATVGVLAGSAVHADLGSIGANDHHNAITLDTNADTLLSLSTQALGLDTQTANYGFFGPVSGAAAVPTFRAMVAADLGTTLSPTFNQGNFTTLDVAGTVVACGLDVASMATGGTVTYSGGYTIHTFTTSGTLVVNKAGNVEVLVIAGGGGGGRYYSGGGGAGGFLYNASYAVEIGSISVTVGAGGAAGTTAAGCSGGDGENSVFGTNIAIGGGGGSGSSGGGVAGRNGGSGGGAGGTGAGSGGTGTVGQGNAGGGTSGDGGAGGGGASAVGSTKTAGGKGGDGSSSTISGASVVYAGGGGGSMSTPGAGGAGGGGKGANDSVPADPGTANTGGGGGGGSNPQVAGAGGSGIVIVRYLTSAIKIDDVQVVSNRVVDARLANATGATFDSLYADAAALIDALRDLVISHGLGAAA